MTGQTTLRFLWAYSASDLWSYNWHQRLIARRKLQGYDIKGFCVTPAALQNRWLPFPELDRGWKFGDRSLLKMYENLAREAEDRDVLILYNGANLHPDFVSWFNLLKVYSAGDDPESTEILTRPIAPAFDIHLVNNIACVPMYKSWGLKNVHFWPLGSHVFEEDVLDLEKSIPSTDSRSTPIVFFGEIVAHWRKDRLQQLSQAFPEAMCAGRGWPRGFISWEQTWAAYRNAQIGWNIHNSTGPINFRTYDLPAHGILQICDNPSFLEMIFQLDKEVIGFNSIEECIEKTRYYLAHVDEQRQIALAGWRKWKEFYTPDQVWKSLVEIVDNYLNTHPSSQPEKAIILSSLNKHWQQTRLLNIYYRVRKKLRVIYKAMGKFISRLVERNEENHALD